MNRMYYAAFAAAATAAVAATPLFAQPQPGGNPPANAAATPGATAPPGEAGQPGGAPPMPGRLGMGEGMWQGGPGAMPWQMMERSPRDWCVERLARRAGLRAYIEAKLDLTAAQRPLWQKVQDAAGAEAQKERQLCDTMKPGAGATVLDRLGRMQQFLSMRLAGLTALKPALEALYNSLTSEQKQIIDDPFRSSAYAAAGEGGGSGGDPGWGGGGGGHPGGGWGGGHPGGGAWGGGGHPGGAWGGGGVRPGGAWGGRYYGWGGRYYGWGWRRPYYGWGWRRPYYGWGWGWGLGAALAYPYYYGYYGYPYDYCYGYNYPFGYCYPYGYPYGGG
jgi:hypothetical protein